MPFHRVLDITVALLVEVYRDLGLKFDDVMRELATQVDARLPAEKKPDPAAEAAALAMLNSQMTGTTFKGARR